MGDNKTIKLTKNAIILTVSNFSSKLLAFIFVPLYTYILTTEEYGVSDIIVTTSSLVTPVFTLLVGEAILRFTLDKNNDACQYLSATAYVFFIGTLILSLFTAVISIFSETIREYAIFFILYYITINAQEILMQFGKGIEKVGIIGVAGVLSSAILITSNIIFLVFLGWGISGYLLSSILAFTLSSIFLILKLNVKKYLIQFKRINKRIFKETFKYTFPMIPNSISWWISNSSDRYMIIYFLGSSFTGLYSVAYKIPSFLTIFTTIFMGAWQISAVEDFGTEGCRKFYEKIYDFIFRALTIICALLILFSKLIGNLFFMKDFKEAWVYGPILLLAFFFNALSAFIGTIYTSAKKTGFLFYSTMIGAIGNIILNFLFIPKIGVYGAAIATLISYFLVWLVRTFNSRRIMVLNINYLSFIFQILLLISEILVVTSQVKYWIIISVVITALLFVINIKSVATNFKDKITSKQGEIKNEPI